MSKRYIFPQQQNDRKKARLDVTISDHNFPLSQNGPTKEPEQNTWGDDNDDEILLLASQACEDAYDDLSSLPDYSVCMQPGSTSTQNLFDPGPSTSKTNFTFKKPTTAPPTVISSNLKDKCSRISSPLPGMSSKVLPKAAESINMTDDLIFNDKIYKGQDSNFLYKQLLQLQEENNNLKSENGKLLEKCVTKEGEASILRTQLKSCQMAVDNARMEKIKAQEKVQMEWTEKLTTANGQMHDLRTQLDFKNLEIISIKERCKMLESNKVKLTQVMVSNNDISSSQRNNHNFNHSFTGKQPVHSARNVKMTSVCAQTEDRAQFFKLNRSCRTEPSKLSPILPIILEPTIDQHSLLEYNEKLQKHRELTDNKCRIYSTFHRIPSTPRCTEIRGSKVNMNILHEDLTHIAVGRYEEKCLDKIFSTIQAVVVEVQSQLEEVSRKVTTAFQKEMDERYIEVSSSCLVVSDRDLLGGNPLHKEEQAILARRMIAVLSYILQAGTDVPLLYKKYEERCTQIFDVLQRICILLDTTSCALLYSGLLLSTTNYIDHFVKETDNSKVIEIVKNIISARPMPFISCQLLKILRRLSLEKKFLENFCPGGSAGNLRLDYDQGVLLYKKDSCYLQVLLKQVESALMCIEKQALIEQAERTTSHLLSMFSNVNDWTTVVDKEKLPGCDCQIMLLQIIVYALRICAVMFSNNRISNEDQSSTRLLAVCRSGTQILYQCVLRDVEFSSQLAHNEGHLIEFCELMRGFEHSEMYANMLSELSGTFQSSPEDASSSFHRQPWIKSFDNFCISD